MIPGAHSIGIVFDPQASTEYDDSDLELTAYSQSPRVYGNRYSEGKDGQMQKFPDIGSSPPLVVTGLMIIVRYVSNS